jgi:DNA-binding MurR/RpiR family transcriptional regulator
MDVSAPKPLAERILDRYDDLSRSERRLADVILENPHEILSHSAAELAHRAGVSNATAARLFKRLGYRSFREARRDSREGAGAKGTASLAANFAQLPGHGTDLALHLTSDLQNLIRSLESMRSDVLNQAIRALVAAEKIWVVGFGDNYPLAHFARALLIRIKPDIRMIPIGGFSVPEEFASITPEDTVLALGLRGGSRALLRIMRSAGDAGAKIVLVTDQTASTTAELATVCLRCRTRGAGLFDSVVAAVSLMTYICSAVATRIGEPAIERLHRIESIHDAWGDLADPDL